LALHDTLRVGVLTSKTQDPAETDRVELFPEVTSWGLRDLPRILAVLRRWRPDIVHVQFPTQGYKGRRLPKLLPLLCRALGFTVVQTWHEPVGPRPLERLFWLLVQTPVSGGLVFVRPNYEQALPGILRWGLHGKTRRFIPNASVIPPVRLSRAEVEAIRVRLLRAGANRLVVYFGFLHPAKGVEQVFQVTDPRTDQLVIIGDVQQADAYHQRIAALAAVEPWKDKVTFTGFLAADEVARIIAAADAVVLPFLNGGGEWNTSIHGAQAQGTFVICTSTRRRGYSAPENTYFARPGDWRDMRAGLERYAGTRCAAAQAQASWSAIAQDHLSLYKEVLG